MRFQWSLPHYLTSTTQFQRVIRVSPSNSLIFGTLVQSDGNSTAPRWVNRAEQAKSRRTVNFQKFCEFKLLPNVENRRKNERTVSFYVNDKKSWLSSSLAYDLQCWLVYKWCFHSSRSNTLNIPLSWKVLDSIVRIH